MRTFTAILAVMSISLLTTWLLVSHHSSPERPEAPKNNPEARALWEFDRVKDPSLGDIPAGIRQKELAFSQQMAAFSSQKQAVNTWEQVGPDTLGGRTRALAVDATDNNTLLAGAVSGGLWKSTDNGTSWTPTLTPTQLPSITALAQDTRTGNTDTWYAGTGEITGNSASGGSAFYRGDGIYKSTNGGDSWTLLPSTSTDLPEFFDQDMDFVWRIVTDPSNATQEEVYAAVYSGIYRSVDGGTSWTEVLQNSGSTYTDVVISSTGTLYAALSHPGNNAGVWRSEDGVSWTNITPSGWSSNSARTTLAIAPSNEDVLYTVTTSPGSGTHAHSIWKYTHSTTTWEDRSANVPGFGSFANGVFNSQGGYDLLISVKPDDENVVFIGGTSLYRSTDGFATDTNISWIAGYSGETDNWSGTHHADQHIVTFSPSNPDIMYTGSDGGLHVTDDIMAATVFWTSLNRGYLSGQFYSVGVDHTSTTNMALIGGTQDNGTWFVDDPNTSTLGEELWGGDGAFVSLLNDGALRYASFQNGQIYRLRYNASNQLSSWALVTPSLDASYLFIHPYVIDPNNSEIMYLPGGTRLLRNNSLSSIPDFQATTHTIGWEEMANTFITGGGTITAITVSESNPDHRVFYGTSAGEVYRLDDANTGTPTAVNVTADGFPSGAYVSSLATHPDDASQVAVVFSNYSVPSVFYSDDAGATWTDVSGSLEENPDGSGSGPSVRWIEMGALSGSDTQFFVGTSTGLYSTTLLDGSATVWTQEGSTSIGNVVVDMIDIRNSDGYIAVGTHGNGFYSSTLNRPEATNGPGGITSNLELWLKADEGISGSTTVSAWADQSINGNNATQNSTNQQPAYVQNGLNYNPALQFDGSLTGDGDFLEGTNGYHDQSVFIVFEPSGTIVPKDPDAWTTAQQLIGADAQGNLSDDAGDVTGIFIGDGLGGKSGELICINGDANNAGSTYNACYENTADTLPGGESILLTFNQNATNNGKDLYKNGSIMSISSGTYEETSNAPYRIGNDWDSFNAPIDGDSQRGEGSYWYNGYIAEVISYSNRLIDVDRIKVESYLGLKYGIGLEHNYVASNGSTLWDLDNNAPFNNDIRGIGQDETSGLNQKQSAGDILAIALGSMAASNTDNTNEFTGDLEFLLWAHDDGALTESEVLFGASEAKLLARTWFVKQKGSAHQVELQFDISQITVTGTDASDFWLVLDTDTNPVTDHRQMIEATSFSSGIVTFSNVTLQNNDYLTLVTDNPGDALLPVELAEFDAFLNGESVYLEWTTESETNNAGFDIERNVQNPASTGWQTVAFAEGQGHSDKRTNYSFKDDVSTMQGNTLVYRLKQIDFDGSIAYSPEVTVYVPAPASYALSAYPNPFNPTTTIQYDVPSEGHVTLTVYDMQGRQVATLVDASQTAGRHHVRFDASHLSSGTYIYRLESGGRSVDNTLLLVK